jgi:heavy metal sensor kinase
VKRRSIGFRLAAWYFLVFACGVGVFSVAAWFAMRASIYHAIDDELRDRIRGVETFMDRQIASLSIPEIRDEFREHSVLGPGGDLFQVCDSQGQWLYRSVALESNNVPIVRPGNLAAPRFEAVEIEHHPLRFYSERISVNGTPYTVQVAAPMREAFEALEWFRLMLIFVAPVLLIAASLGGYWISKRALDPVDQISHAAQRISIENLADRLQVPQTGDQLQRLSETLNQMFSRLEGSVRRIKQFTADASHELRAPISLIRTTAEVAALRRNRPSAEYLEALDEILAESERTSQVVDSLMLLARADSGKETLDSMPIDATNIVRGAAEQGEKLARNHGLHFEVSVPDISLPVLGDTDALRRALLILMDNAANYTPPGGSVKVTQATINGFAVISVIDTGIGIAHEEVPHIFDRFWRSDKARSREHGGAGLGLSIAKWIAEMHGGTVEVESEPGKGSVFRLRVPLDHGANGSASVEPQVHWRMIGEGGATLQTPESKVDELLRTAIQHKRMVRFRYENRDRILEPHDYGVQKGCVRLLGYQVGGSSSGTLPNWRWIDVDGISDLELLGRTFKGGRPAPSGKHHKWDQLFIRVKPPEEDPE